MTKKILTLVMVISVLGAFVAGCGQKADEPAATAGATAGAAATAGDAGATK